MKVKKKNYKDHWICDQNKPMDGWFLKTLTMVPAWYDKWQQLVAVDPKKGLLSTNFGNKQ